MPDVASSLPMATPIPTASTKYIHLTSRAYIISENQSSHDNFRAIGRHCLSPIYSRLTNEP